MNRPLLQSALRVLSSLAHGQHPNAPDVEVLKTHALPDELELAGMDDLARSIAVRVLAERTAARRL